MKQFKINPNFTNRKDESLDRYLVEINRVPMISPDREVELAQTIRKGGAAGDKAKEQLVTANLRFVVSVAKQYQHQGIPLPDLINEGNLGLITAAGKFDETRGFKFISYRRPQSQVAVSNKIRKATNDFIQQHQRHPTAEELSEIISLEVDKIEKAIQSEARVNSLDAPVSDDVDTTVADSLASSSDFAADRTVDHESMCADLMQVLGEVLSERERQIVIQTFGIGCPERSLDDIGLRMGLTRERVRQIRERSLDKVRNYRKSRLLLGHLVA